MTATLRAQNLYLMNVLAVFVDLGKVSGRHRESGLLALKLLAEPQAR